MNMRSVKGAVVVGRNREVASILTASLGDAGLRRKGLSWQSGVKRAL